jgi:hypothetical protein
MKVLEGNSPAFHTALLESERRRIYGITAFLFVFAVAIAARILIFGSHMSPWSVFVLLAVVAYELWTLSVVTRALKTGAKLSEGLLLFNVILEMVVPALGVAYFSSPRLAFEYRPIATPWVLAFFPLLMLSVLRINPRVSQIAGVVAVVGYLAGAYYLGWRPSLENLRQHTAEQTAVVFYAAILLASGFIAGMISGEVRKHVQAALHDAETQRQLKEVEHDLLCLRFLLPSMGWRSAVGICLPTLRAAITSIGRGCEMAALLSHWRTSRDTASGPHFSLPYAALMRGRASIHMTML